MIAVLKSQISMMQFPSQKPRLFGNLSKNNHPPLITYRKPHKKAPQPWQNIMHCQEFWPLVGLIPGILASSADLMDPHQKLRRSLRCNPTKVSFTQIRDLPWVFVWHRKLGVPFVVQGWAKVKIKKYSVTWRCAPGFTKSYPKLGCIIYSAPKDSSHITRNHQ